MCDNLWSPVWSVVIFVLLQAGEVGARKEVVIR